MDTSFHWVWARFPLASSWEQTSVYPSFQTTDEDWDGNQKPQDDFKSCCPIFSLPGVNCSPQTWGHCRIQNCIKECQVVFFPPPWENNTDTSTLYSFLSSFSQHSHLDSESPTNAQMPKITEFFPCRLCAQPAANL